MKVARDPGAISRRPAHGSFGFFAMGHRTRIAREVYQPSTRAYKGLPDIDYPFHDKIIVVTHCGRICLGHKKINFSTVFAGQAVGNRRSSRRHLAR
jgi:hypothetical protein